MQSIKMDCPYCKKEVMTNVEKIAGIVTWSWCIGCSLIGCYCCAPCAHCADGLKEAEHKCNDCGQVIGYRKAL